MSDVAIRVEGLGKKYRIGARQGQSRTLRESLVDAVRSPAARVRSWYGRGARDTASRQEFWALRDVGFEVRHGEVLGVIGRNGAGKSTLLKLLSRITEPTTGLIAIAGRVAALLEVGTGFHQELTGRENVFLNGAILGMTRADIRRRFDEIVAFAEVDDFIDTQVKRYSSGMYLRLAFAVAAHLEPEILVVDEVLAVGDAQFQRKCLGKMGEVAGEGRTVLFVSHNMGAVQALCSRGIWLDGGEIQVDGATATVVSQYLSSVFATGLISDNNGAQTAPLQIRKVLLTKVNGGVTAEISPADGLRVEIHYFASRRLESPQFWIGIESQFGPLIGASMLFDGRGPRCIEGEGVLACTFHSLPLVPQQTYRLTMGVRAQDGVTILVPSRDIGFFQVVGRMGDYGLYGEQADVLASSSSPLMLPYEWHLPDGSTAPVHGFAREGLPL